MKKIFTLILGAAVMASAQALPYKKAELGAAMRPETKAVHQTDMSIDAGASRASGLWKVDPPIYDLPEGGDYHLYRRSSEMIYSSMSGLVMASDDYFAGEVVFYDNGDVYMRNMIPSMFSGSYLKGTLEGNKITMQFPQGICYDNPHYDADGNLVTDGVWPVFRADYVMGQVWDDEYEEYVGTIDVLVDQNNQTITFDINEDGSITSPTDVMLGVFTRGEIWYGESAWNYKYVPFDEKPIAMPEGAEVQDWVFYDAYSATMTKMAFDGSDIYWQGMCASVPDGVVKGTVDGDKVYFKSPCYLGIDEGSAHLAYFAGTETENNWLKIVSNPEFEYDATAGEITYPRKYVIVNAGPERFNIIAQFNSPTIHRQAAGSQLGKPETPVIDWVSKFEYDQWLGVNCWFTVFELPNLDVNGNLLDKSRMWYNIFFDNDLYWFDSEDYHLVADSPDVPYTYNDDDMIVYRGGFQHQVTFLWTGFDRMGIQSVFEDVDGNVFKSDIAEYFTTGIAQVEEEAQVAAVAYFDLQGRKITNPKGLCLKQSIMADGSVVTKKIVVK